MENVNRLLLENVLPAHVAAHFIGDKLNEVWCWQGLGRLGRERRRVWLRSGACAFQGRGFHPCYGAVRRCVVWASAARPGLGGLDGSCG